MAEALNNDEVEWDSTTSQINPAAPCHNSHHFLFTQEAQQTRNLIRK